MAAAAPRQRWALFDWGGTLMSEEGPLDLPMALWPEVAAIDGAHETLATLSRRYRIGVATNASVSRRNMIEVALGRVGLRDYVSEIFCYTEIGERKDSDEFWRAALERLGAEPDDVAMVGDSLDQDVLAPRRFGIYSVWFDPSGRGAAPAGVPSVTRLADAVALLDSHFRAHAR
jgi:FMN phosphatase YigB (HAD superfamily)